MVAVALTACTSQAPDCGALEVAHAWVRAVPVDAGMTGGYLVLRNPGQNSVRVTAMASKDFGRVEMHQTKIEDGVAHMRALSAVVVPAGGKLAFAPGGRHLMLFDPATPLIAGRRVSMRLACDNEQRAFTAQVRARAPVE